MHNLAVVALVNRVVLLGRVLRNLLFRRSISLACVVRSRCVRQTLLLAAREKDLGIQFGLLLVNTLSSYQINILKSISSRFFGPLSF